MLFYTFLMSSVELEKINSMHSLTISMTVKGIVFVLCWQFINSYSHEIYNHEISYKIPHIIAIPTYLYVKSSQFSIF